MGMQELEALKTTLVRNQEISGWCTIAVFAGLVAEYTILLWLKRHDLSRTELTLTILAGLAIAGGVYGEFHFGSKASEAALKLEEISEAKIADAQERAAKADLKRVELQTRILDIFGTRNLTKAQVGRIT